MQMLLKRRPLALLFGVRLVCIMSAGNSHAGRHRPASSWPSVSRRPRVRLEAGCVSGIGGVIVHGRA